MKISVFCPDRKVFDSKTVDAVTLQGSEGQIQVLPGHAAMVGTIDTGVISFSAPGGESAEAVVSHGFFQIEDDHVTVLAGTLEFPSEIDLARAETAYRNAESKLKAASDIETIEKGSRKLRRAELRREFGKKGSETRH